MKTSALTLMTSLLLATSAIAQAQASDDIAATGFEKRVLFSSSGYKLNELQTRCSNGSQYKTELVIDSQIRLPAGDYYYQVTCYVYVPVR